MQTWARSGIVHPRGHELPPACPGLPTRARTGQAAYPGLQPQAPTGRASPAGATSRSCQPSPSPATSSRWPPRAPPRPPRAPAAAHLPPASRAPAAPPNFAATSNSHCASHCPYSHRFPPPLARTSLSNGRRSRAKPLFLAPPGMWKPQEASISAPDTKLLCFPPFARAPNGP